MKRLFIFLLVALLANLVLALIVCAVTSGWWGHWVLWQRLLFCVGLLYLGVLSFIVVLWARIRLRHDTKHVVWPRKS